MAETSRTAALRGAELTNRLLSFARQETLEPRATAIGDLLLDLKKLLRRTLSEDIEIEIVVSADLWAAMIDPAQLEAALLNLSINARDAMLGGGRLTIEAANRWINEEYASQNADIAPGAYVVIAVSDTGTGIAPEHLGQVFDPFFTTKEVGKGTGLGLSMVYGFVKQSSGHVKVYSEIDCGTTIRMYLPRAELLSPHAHHREPHVEIVGGKETILGSRLITTI